MATPKASKYTAFDLYEKLYWQYGKLMSVAVVPEASIGHSHSSEAGYKAIKALGGETTVRRIDALILFPDKRWAVEIKVSLSDLKSELANPAKQELWAKHTHAFYFLVAPPLLAYALEHVPKQFGVMTADAPVEWTDWRGNKILGYTNSVKIMRRAKSVKTPLELPYATIRRMGFNYAKARYELALLKKSSLNS